MDGNTVVILADYEEDMREMLEKNAGLKLRFTSYVKFEDMIPEKCASIVSSVLKAQISLFSHNWPIVHEFRNDSANVVRRHHLKCFNLAPLSKRSLPV